MTASSQYPYNNQQHGRPIQPIRPQQHQTYLPQYNNNIPQLPPQSTNGGMGYNLNDTPVFQRPQPGPQQPTSSIQVIDFGGWTPKSLCYSISFIKLLKINCP